MKWILRGLFIFLIVISIGCRVTKNSKETKKVENEQVEVKREVDTIDRKVNKKVSKSENNEISKKKDYTIVIKSNIPEKPAKVTRVVDGKEESIFFSNATFELKESQTIQNNFSRIVDSNIDSTGTEKIRKDAVLRKVEKEQEEKEEVKEVVKLTFGALALTIIGVLVMVAIGFLFIKVVLKFRL